MRFKWFFILFVLATAIGIAMLLPYAHAIAREVRKCRDAFPRDLARLEEHLRNGDMEGVYSMCTSDLRQSTDPQTLGNLNYWLVPSGVARLAPCGAWSSFGLQAQWVDPTGRPVSAARLQFLWEEEQNRLHRVPGVIDVRSGGR